MSWSALGSKPSRWTLISPSNPLAANRTRGWAVTRRFTGSRWRGWSGRSWRDGSPTTRSPRWATPRPSPPGPARPHRSRSTAQKLPPTGAAIFEDLRRPFWTCFGMRFSKESYPSLSLFFPEMSLPSSLFLLIGAAKGIIKGLFLAFFLAITCILCSHIKDFDSGWNIELWMMRYAQRT